MLDIVPITLAEANAFVERHHATHGPRGGHKFSIAAFDIHDGRKAEPGVFGDVVGVAIVGRPSARLLDDGLTVEITRLCVARDPSGRGYPNACSKLLASCAQAARGLGYKRVITYTKPEEGGGSLRAAGWKIVARSGGDTWNRPGCGRPRVDLNPNQQRLRWEAP